MLKLWSTLELDVEIYSDGLHFIVFVWMCSWIQSLFNELCLAYYSIPYSSVRSVQSFLWIEWLEVLFVQMLPTAFSKAFQDLVCVPRTYYGLKQQVLAKLAQTVRTHSLPFFLVPIVFSRFLLLIVRTVFDSFVNSLICKNFDCACKIEIFPRKALRNRLPFKMLQEMLEI